MSRRCREPKSKDTEQSGDPLLDEMKALGCSMDRETYLMLAYGDPDVKLSPELEAELQEQFQRNWEEDWGEDDDELEEEE
jgi:hypothetical protein